MLKISHFSPTKFRSQIKENNYLTGISLFVLILKQIQFPCQNSCQELVIAYNYEALHHYLNRDCL